jgi:DNA-binding response OmpR family regulator
VIAAQLPGVPVLVTARRDSLLDRVRVLQQGARVFLPRPIAAEEVFNAVARLLPRSGAAAPRILAVDDDPTILSALRALLEPQGFRVHTLDSPLRFWTVLQDTLPDLLILDVDMPHLNGIELCRVVRGDARWNELPILFLTARSDMETLLRIFATGADDYVSKPIVSPALLARIRARLGRHRTRR